MKTMTADVLTTREAEILALFEQRLSNREIGAKLCLTVGIVKWYAQQIYNKLGVSKRGNAVQVAQAMGLLDSEQTANTVLPQFV